MKTMKSRVIKTIREKTSLIFQVFFCLLGLGFIISEIPLPSFINREIELKITATAQKNSLSKGSEVGIIQVLIDGTVVPWSEFEWSDGWDKINERPYFHSTYPATLKWTGQASSDVTLQLYYAPNCGSISVSLNGLTKNIDLYKEAPSQVKEVSLPFVSKYLWITLVPIILVFIYFWEGGRARIYFFFIILTGCIIINLTFMNPLSQVPIPRLVSGESLKDFVYINQAKDLGLLGHFFPDLNGSELIISKELLTEISPSGEYYGAERMAVDEFSRWIKRSWILKNILVNNYPINLLRDEEQYFMTMHHLTWQQQNGNTFILVPSTSDMRIYILKKYKSYYFFIPIELFSNQGRH